MSKCDRLRFWRQKKAMTKSVYFPVFCGKYTKKDPDTKSGSLVDDTRLELHTISAISVCCATFYNSIYNGYYL